MNTEAGLSLIERAHAARQKREDEAAAYRLENAARNAVGARENLCRAIREVLGLEISPDDARIDVVGDTATEEGCYAEITIDGLRLGGTYRYRYERWESRLFLVRPCEKCKLGDAWADVQGWNGDGWASLADALDSPPVHQHGCHDDEALPRRPPVQRPPTVEERIVNDLRELVRDELDARMES